MFVVGIQLPSIWGLTFLAFCQSKAIVSSHHYLPCSLLHTQYKVCSFRNPFSLLKRKKGAQCSVSSSRERFSHPSINLGYGRAWWRYIQRQDLWVSSQNSTCHQQFKPARSKEKELISRSEKFYLIQFHQHSHSVQ